MPQPEDSAERTTIADPPAAEPIPTYMSQAVMATLLCFPFTGAAAIVYASQVSVKRKAGDLDGAWIASKKARRMVWWSVILGILMVALTILGGLALTLYLAYLLEA